MTHSHAAPPALADLQPFDEPAPPLSTEERQVLLDADRSALWKPFTQMAGYVEGEPLILREGRGNWLRDIDGRVFLDGVSSLWVSVHGHSHPTIVRRVREQLDTLDHATMLGPSTLPAVQLAEKLVKIAPGHGHLSRVFYSDSGSTAVEIAVKMAYQYFAQHRDESQRKRNVFVTLSGAYHGDTLGSVSVGGIDLFHQIYAPLLFSTRQAPGPDPYHRAFGEDPVAHEAACLRALELIFEEESGKVAALVMEPLMQGASGMLRHSVDFLRSAAALAREHGALLIIDEVATGFGRSGRMFACDVAGVVPDLLCMAKGISGGVLPLAATLASEQIYEGFLGDYTEYRTFFHGHSYTGNPLACAAALASLEVFEEERTLERLAPRIEQLESWLNRLNTHPHVGSIRRLGVMVGIELVANKRTGTPFDAGLRVGNRVIEAALNHGLLIRPLGDVVVLMPTLAITEDELNFLCTTVERSINEALNDL